MFQDHHELASMGHLAEHLKAEARKHYGHAARLFLRGISDEWPRHAAMVSQLRDMEAAWIASAVPPSADGQVRRVAARFALVAVAGELAQRMGVLPWPEGEASQGASICFQAWLDRRGHIGASERERGLQAVVDFLALHGLSRFAEWNNPDAKPVNMAGVRKASESGGVKLEDGWDFYLTPTGWKEACRGFESRGVARDAIEEGLLEASQDGAPYQKRKTPHGQGRFYVIRARGLGTFRAGVLT
jgi:putative DNA primase/helicase